MWAAKTLEMAFKTFVAILQFFPGPLWERDEDLKYHPWGCAILLLVYIFGLHLVPPERAQRSGSLES